MHLLVPLDRLVTTTTRSYYPHHLPAAATYAIVGALVIVALLIVRKLIGLAILCVIAAVALALYHHGVINQWFKTGQKYHQVRVQVDTKAP